MADLIPVVTPDGVVNMSDADYAAYTSGMGRLPVLSSQYVFGNKIPRPQTDASGNIRMGALSAPTSQMTPDGVPLDVAKTLIKRYESNGGDYNVGWGNTPLAGSALDASGFPIWGGLPGPQGQSHAAGAYQFEPGTWATFAKQAGVSDFSPASQDAVADQALLTDGLKHWAPYNPKLASALQRYKETGTMDTSGYPPFANARQMASLMPATDATPDPTTAPPPAAFDGTGALPLGSLNINGIPPPSGGNVDQAALVQNLLNGGGGTNTAKLLANMSAGFLGGNGLANSLSKGMAGAAASQKEDATDSATLAKLQMIYGPAQQEKVLEARQKNADMAIRTGMQPSVAFALHGVPLPAGVTAEQLDKAAQYGKPMPAGALKAEENNLENISTQRTFQSQSAQYEDMLKKGEANGGFNLDKLSLARYKIDNSGLPFTSPTPASQNYQQFQAFLSNAQQNVLNSNKGAASDQRLDAAMAALTGGGSLSTNEQGITHLHFLGNQSALAEKNLRGRIDSGRKAVRQPEYGWEDFDKSLSPSPYSGQTAAQSTGQLVAGGNAQTPAAAPSGQTGVTASGTKYRIVP